MLGLLLRVLVLLLPFALIIFVIAKIRGARSAPLPAEAHGQPEPFFGLQSLSFGLLAALTLYVATMEVV
ncbi:hypothetical protein [Pseudorhodobacter sp.]|uniref:hypothetical protein n=1 Tax=Pseudorhodobacter sp. TaxID=1934400 RepID=UPI002AFE4372|nr:hypothetical protein [Pseudorhodobacter sp.]